MTARFSLGESVRIQDRAEPRHNRVPSYARGQTGTVVRVCGAFGQPEKLAEGGAGQPDQVIYRVRIAQSQLWPDYQGRPDDKLEIEIFEHWLEAAPNAG
jgi:nitrile hydratase|tara:strand:+ start:2969 stop:3265 length:297 start_codon:yes stop_codon:yes gene_type:complete